MALPSHCHTSSQMQECLRDPVVQQSSSQKAHAAQCVKISDRAPPAVRKAQTAERIAWRVQNNAKEIVEKAIRQANRAEQNTTNKGFNKNGTHKGMNTHKGMTTHKGMSSTHKGVVSSPIPATRLPETYRNSSPSRPGRPKSCTPSLLGRRSPRFNEDFPVKNKNPHANNKPNPLVANKNLVANKTPRYARERKCALKIKEVSNSRVCSFYLEVDSEKCKLNEKRPNTPNRTGLSSGGPSSGGAVIGGPVGSRGFAGIAQAGISDARTARIRKMEHMMMELAQNPSSKPLEFDEKTAGNLKKSVGQFITTEEKVKAMQKAICRKCHSEAC